MWLLFDDTYVTGCVSRFGGLLTAACTPRADVEELAVFLRAVGGRAVEGMLPLIERVRACLLYTSARQPLACGLSVALTVMEEVGGQGARTAASLLAPTHAVAVDVSFGHTPDAPRPKCGVMGDGPMIGVSPILDHAMFEGMKACAKRHSIDFQVEVMGGNTGTDVYKRQV